MGLQIGKGPSTPTPFAYTTPPEPVWFVELAGGPASGKTHLALSFPSPALLDTEKKGYRILEKGVGRKDKYFIPNSWDDVLGFWDHALHDSEISTIVVDSSKDILDMAYEATLEELGKKWGRTVDSLYSKDAGAVNYRFLNNRMADLLKQARDCNKNVIFTARLKDVYDSQGNKTGSQTRDGWSRAPYYCDFCLEAVPTFPGINPRKIGPGLIIWKVQKNGAVVRGRFRPYIVMPPSITGEEAYRRVLADLTTEYTPEDIEAYMEGIIASAQGE